MFNKMTITNCKYLKDSLTDKNHAVMAVIDGKNYSVTTDEDV